MSPGALLWGRHWSIPSWHSADLHEDLLTGRWPCRKPGGSCLWLLCGDQRVWAAELISCYSNPPPYSNNVEGFYWIQYGVWPLRPSHASNLAWHFCMSSLCPWHNLDCPQNKWIKYCCCIWRILRTVITISNPLTRTIYQQLYGCVVCLKIELMEVSMDSFWTL
jgi:hypothetical protein